MRFIVIDTRIITAFLLLFSSVMLVLSWPPINLTYLIFFSLVPLIFICESSELSAKIKLILIYIALLLFNIGTTYWIYKLVLTNGIILHLVVPAIQIIPFLILILFNGKGRMNYLKSLLFICTWLSVEYLQINWKLAYPFLNFGNSLASQAIIIQWYEYTGVLGGSLWILVVNMVIYKILTILISSQGRQNKKLIKYSIALAIIFSTPIFISFVIYNNIIKSENHNSRTVVVLAVHPNLDCYNEKYNKSPEELVDDHLKITLNGITDSTVYVLWPENAIVGIGWYSEMHKSKLLKKIIKELEDFKNIKLITGATVYELSDSKDVNANFSTKVNQWFNTYNSAIQIDLSNNSISHRTKEKLVPFEESNPFPKFKKLTAMLFQSLGKFNFSSRKYNDRVFQSDKANTVTLICYELLFGEYVSSLVKQGGEAVFVILNEGWYDNATASSQFMYYTCLRAIENRKSIVRSSNKGITCMIDSKGEIQTIIANDDKSFLQATIKLNKTKTFYMYFGDYLGKIASILLFLLIGYYGIKRYISQPVK